MATQTELMEEKIQEPMQEVLEQEKYYLDSLGVLMLILILAGTLAAGLFFLMIGMRTLQSPAPTYFPATDTGQLFREPPLNKPSVSTTILLNWVTDVMMTVNTFNFVNFQNVINKSTPYFTKEGYENYKAALAKLKILETVQKQKLVLRAQPAAPPQILKEGVLAERYLWKIKVPMVFDYKSINTALSDQVEATVLVLRVPTAASPLGIQILKYDLNIVKPG